MQLCSPGARWALQAVPIRKVLRDDGKGRLVAEVERAGQWKFLCFSGSFAMRLYVYQDKRRGTVGLLCSLLCLPSAPLPSRAEDDGLLQIDFKLARPGLMKNFEGKWRVQPFTQATLGELSGQHQAHPWPRWLPAALDNLHFRAPLRAVGGIRVWWPLGFVSSSLHCCSDEHTTLLWPEIYMCIAAGKQNTASASLVTLEQSILPGLIPPKPLDRLIKGKFLMTGACALSCSAVRLLMQD